MSLFNHSFAPWHLYRPAISSIGIGSRPSPWPNVVFSAAPSTTSATTALAPAEEEAPAVREKEINDDMQVNNALRKGYSKEFQSAQGSDAANCHCDCQNSASEFKVKAATMLAQVGDSMFFGKCASCPCMRKTDVETEVNMLAGLLEAASAMGQNITSDIGAHIPVDIDIRVGPKGGAPSPVLPRDAATQPRHAPRVE